MTDASLKNELRRLDDRLRGATVSRHWRPGQSSEEIAGSVRGVVDIPIPTEAIDWYGWHGGVEERDGQNQPELSPDGLVHAGLDQIIPKITAAMDTFQCTYDELWPGHEVFPLAIDHDAGIHWLHRTDHTAPWTLWQTGKDWELQPHWDAHRARPAEGPTLLMWVSALNEAFDRGDVLVSPDGAVVHRKSGSDARYANYPWPGSL